MLVWLGAIAAVYFAPGARTGLRELAHSSLPDAGASSALLLTLPRLAAATGIGLAAWGIGRAMLRLPAARAVRSAPGLETFLTATGLGLGILTVVALALSPLGLLRSAALIAVVGVGVMLALAQLVRARRRPLPRPARDPLGAALLVLIAIGAAFALIAALAPEVEYDAVWYHLDFPQRYLAAGSLVDDRCEYVSLYPMGAELLFAYGLAFGSPVVAKLVGFGFWVLFVLAAYELASRAGGRRAALAAAAVAALTPTALWEATTAYVDLAVAVFLTLSLGWVLRFAERGGTAPLVLAGLFGGFALAVKTLALIGLAPLAAVLLLSERGAPLRRRIGHAALFGAAALLPAAPWLLRAQLEGGNPVFPSLYGVFGADADRWSERAAEGLERSLDRWGHGDGIGGLLSLPWDLTMHAASFAGSLGVLYLMLVPPAFTRRLPRPALLCGAFALLYVLLWASPPSSQQLRFLLPVVPVLALLAGLGLERARELAERLHPRLGTAVAVFVVAVLGLTLPPFTGLHDREGEQTLVHVLRGAPVDVVTGAEGERAYLERRIPAYAAARALSRRAAPGERAVGLTDPFTDLYAGVRLIPDYSACIPGAGAQPGDRRSELEALGRLGVRWLLIEPGLRREQGTLAITRRAPPAGMVRKLYDDGRAVLYRLLPAG